MKFFIQSVAVLICAMVAQGDICRFNVPVTSSDLKCDYFVYHADQKTKDAVNHCGEGRNGTEITTIDYFCIFDKLGYRDEDMVNMDKLSAGYKENFRFHAEMLIRLAEGCWNVLVDTGSSLLGDPEFFSCLLRTFSKHCGHNTCDWINTFDETLN
ncbi:unnamed protein product [Allacma fusca]|uniref:Uncharacterized protein n=1 Tax=Allacma fusca TaxID=39272 RepID=A0A8J2JKS6_9HEXA|nr:unnamed protein product [Allacma fusca]